MQRFKQTILPFLWAFLWAFFAFSLMIMATVLWITPYSRPKDTRTLSSLSLPKESDRLTVLIVHHSQQLYSLSVLSFLPDQGRITFDTLSPDQIEPYEEPTQAETIRKLTQRSSQVLGQPIQRYLLLTDEQLLHLLNQWNPPLIYLEEPLIYTQNGMNLVLSAGLQALSGEQCLHYLHSASDKDSFMQRSQALLCSFLEQNFKLCADITAQDDFLFLLDHCNTDLSLSDFDQYHSAWSFMAQLISPNRIIEIQLYP